MKKCHVDFRSEAHAKEAWSCIVKVFNDYQVSPAMSGLLMETMSDLAEAIDKHIFENTPSPEQIELAVFSEIVD